MLTLSVKIRKDLGKKVKTLRKRGIIPGVLYGPKIKTTQPLELDEKEFEKTYQEAGESSLISLEVVGQVGKKEKYLVLIHEVAKDSLTEKPIHVDFYQPKLEEEVKVTIPIIFEGESPAVKDLGGTLVKNISELEVKALPQKLPHEIKVNISQLKSFEDNILIKDLRLPEGVKLSRAPEEILAFVARPKRIEEELEKPIEEKVEEVEKVAKEKKEKVEEKETKKQ